MNNTRSFNLADILRSVADAVPERLALIYGDEQLTYEELDARSTRLASALQALGIGRGDNVGLQLANSPAYVETFFACCKLGARPTNINYRYVADELMQLFESLDLRALVYGKAFEEPALEAAAAVPGLDVLVCSGGMPTGQGVHEYAALLAGAGDELLDQALSGDDELLLCTGGTTGMPKGVIWTHEALFFGALGGGGLYFGQGPVASLEQLAAMVTQGPPLRFMALAPLMHGAALWSCLISLFSGHTVVLQPGTRFDAEQVWDAVECHRVNILSGVGDAMALPLVQALEANPGRWQLDQLFMYGNGGAPLSLRTKDRLRQALPTLQVNDGMGSSESGVIGSGDTVVDGEGLIVLSAREDLAVLDEQGRALTEPGAEGNLARTGWVPRGYYGDPRKTAETFVQIDGRTWVITGDRARVEAGGRMVLLGRGSQCINTGGEKVFPEEVENALRHYLGVADILVLGIEDERWGQQVAAIVKPAEPATDFSLDELLETGRERLAGYKLPRTVYLASQIQRSPAGKPDYRWARQYVAENTPTLQI